MKQRKKEHMTDNVAQSETGGIFAGLKVIDCSNYVAGPAAATVLSDFGADVIKIEPPGTGDPVRYLPDLPGYPLSEHNYVWMLEARNKRSIALDLRQPEGQAVLHRLASEADVFITNFPLQVRERLRISHDDIAPLNPRLIYASFTGFGEVGEEANMPGFDTTAWWARSGLMDLVRDGEDATPARSVPGMGDHPCALSLYGAIVTALFQRERTGKGAHVRSNLMANGVWSSGVQGQAVLCGAKFQKRRARDEAHNPFTNHYRCQDGRWLILSLLAEERQWPVFARTMDMAELIDDPRFLTKADRQRHSGELIRLLDDRFATKDFAEWRTILDGKGLAFSVVSVIGDLAHDRQMQENEVLVPFEDADMMTISSPLWIEGETKTPPRLPPSIGQHSDQILEQAGYEDREIAALRASGIIA